MAGRLENKVALVTGGSSGIGRASALAFAREGARVVVSSDVNVTGGEETVSMIKKAGGEAIFVKADVTSAAEVKALIDKTVETYGRLDCAHNNAGIVGLTRAAALEYASANIRVNAVCPGPTATALLQRTAASDPEGRAKRGASFVTGCIMAVDGGYTAR